MLPNFYLFLLNVLKNMQHYRNRIVGKRCFGALFPLNWRFDAGPYAQNVPFILTSNIHYFNLLSHLGLPEYDIEPTLSNVFTGIKGGYGIYYQDIVGVPVDRGLFSFVYLL